MFCGINSKSRLTFVTIQNVRCMSSCIQVDWMQINWKCDFLLVKVNKIILWLQRSDFLLMGMKIFQGVRIICSYVNGFESWRVICELNLYNLVYDVLNWFIPKVHWTLSHKLASTPPLPLSPCTACTFSLVRTSCMNSHSSKPTKPTCILLPPIPKSRTRPCHECRLPRPDSPWTRLRWSQGVRDLDRWCILLGFRLGSRWKRTVMVGGWCGGW